MSAYIFYSEPRGQWLATISWEGSYESQAGKSLLSFSSKEAAILYCESQEIHYRVKD